MKEPAFRYQGVINQVSSHFHWLSQYRDNRDVGDSRGFDPNKVDLAIARVGGRIGALEIFETLFRRKQKE
jgi:hypothetical protein